MSKILDTILPQCRTLHAQLWDKYQAAGYPKGMREKDLTDWLLETGQAAEVAEPQKKSEKR